MLTGMNFLNMLPGFGLYNSFGSCGSYGLGNNNCFNQSIWSGIGMMAAAQIIPNVGNWISNLGSSSSEVEPELSTVDTISDDVDTLNEKINDKLKDLYNTNEEDYEKVEVAAKFETAVTDAKTELEDAKKELQSHELTKPAPLGTGATEEQKVEYQTQLKSYLENKSKLDAEVEKAKAELEKANEAKTEEVNRIKTLKDELKTLIEQRDNAVKDLRDAKLDEADGTAATRTTKKRFEAKFGTTYKLEKNEAKVTKGDLYYMLAQYRAASDNDKNIWANRFREAMTNKDVNINLRLDPTLRKGLELIKQEQPKQ